MNTSEFENPKLTVSGLDLFELTQTQGPRTYLGKVKKSEQQEGSTLHYITLHVHCTLKVR